MTTNRDEEEFYRISDLFSQKEPDISIGKMMSSPGIKYKSMVITFCHDDEMIFLVGKKFDIKKHSKKIRKF